MKKNTKKVLIIDDNEDIQKIIQLYLEEKNCQFFTLSDGQFADQIFNKKNIDLVICDMIMPISDGIEVIQKIKKTDSDAKVIGISGGNTGNGQDYLTLAKEFGASSVLYKPFTRNELLKSIDSIGFSFSI